MTKTNSLAMIIRYRHVVTSLFAFLLVFSILGLARLKIVTNADAFIDPSLTAAADYRHLKDLFPNQSEILILARPVASICQLKEPWFQLLRDLPSLSVAQSIFDIPQVHTTSSGEIFYRPASSEFCGPSPSPFPNTPWNSILASENFSDVLFQFSWEETSKEDSAKILMLVQDQVRKWPAEVFLAGSEVFNSSNRDGMLKIQWLNLLGLSMMMGLLWFFFRSIKGPLIFAGILLILNLIIHGLMGWLGHPVDSLSLSVVFMLLIASTEDFVFLSQSQQQTQRIWLAPYQRLFVPSFLTSLTTFIGFISLMTSDLTTLRQFGLWAALGSLLQWVLMFIVLPALAWDMPILRRWAPPRCDLFKSIAAPVPSRRIVLVIIALTLVFAGNAIVHFHRFGSPVDVFRSQHPLSLSMQEFRKQLGWKSAVSVLFKRFEPREEQERLLQDIQRHPLVATTDSPYLALQYLTEKTAGPIREMIEREYLSTAMSQRYLAKTGETRALLYLKSTDTAEIFDLLKYTTEICRDQCHLSGELVAVAEFSQKVVKSLYISLMVSLALVIVVLLIIGIGKKVRAIPVLVLSVIWGPAALIIVFFLFDVPIDLVSCIVLNVLVGLAGDNLIQFLFHPKGVSRGLATLAPASFKTALLMVVLSLVFLGSDFIPTQQMGLMMAVGVLLTVLGDIGILAGLLNKKAPVFTEAS